MNGVLWLIALIVVLVLLPISWPFVLLITILSGGAWVSGLLQSKK